MISRYDIVFLSSLFACVAPLTQCRSDESKRDLPWHLADVRWTLTAPCEIQSISLDIAWIADVAQSNPILFVSPFNACFNDELFYFGCMTDMDGQRSTGGRLAQNIGAGFVFSKFGDMHADLVRVTYGGHRLLSSDEGKFASVRFRYPWGEHRNLTFSLKKMDKEIIGGKPFIWVGAFVTKLSEENMFIGAIRFKGEKLMLNDNFFSFVELCDRNVKRYPTRLSKNSIGFGNLRINNLPVTPKSVSAEFESDVPAFASVVSTEWQLKQSAKLPHNHFPRGDGAFIVHVNEIKGDRQSDIVQVFPAK